MFFIFKILFLVVQWHKHKLKAAVDILQTEKEAHKKEKATPPISFMSVIC